MECNADSDDDSDDHDEDGFDDLRSVNVICLIQLRHAIISLQ